MTLIEQYGMAPDAIEIKSFAMVEELLPPDLQCTPSEREVIKRMIHAAGDPSIVRDIRIHPEAVAAGLAALQAGATIFTDVQMVHSGINKLGAGKYGCAVECIIDAPAVVVKARAEGTTRAVAAVRLTAPRLAGGIVAIGNAPTALLELLDQIDAGLTPPALVVGMPVGFVAAAESKDELVQRGVPYISLLGWRGGSAVCVAAVNALLRVMGAYGAGGIPT